MYINTYKDKTYTYCKDGCRVMWVFKSSTRAVTSWEVEQSGL